VYRVVYTRVNTLGERVVYPVNTLGESPLCAEWCLSPWLESSAQSGASLPWLMSTMRRVVPLSHG